MVLWRKVYLYYDRGLLEADNDEKTSSMLFVDTCMDQIL